MTYKNFLIDKYNFPYHYKYNNIGYKKIFISDNISAICFRGEDTNGIEEQVISAYININIPEISESCFAECKNLTAINANNNINKVGNYAFYNCESLTGINFLEDENKTLKYIGSYSFYNSGLKEIKINLQSSVSDSSINAYAFANCKQLTAVYLLNAPYLGGHMFDGCTSLSKIYLNNKHSYVNAYCFANCTSLESIDIPSNMYMLASHMFDGCTNLKNINFPDDSILKYIEDGVFANCSKLTSITLPASVNSLSLIDGEFLAGSNIQKVTFKGISDDIFVNEVKVTNYSLSPSCIYETYTDVKNILDSSLTSNIPLVCIKSNDNGCGICKNYKNKIYDTDYFKKWIKTENTYYWVLGYCDSNGKTYDEIQNFQDKYLNRSGTYYCQVGFYWKKADGTEVKNFMSGIQTYAKPLDEAESYINELKNNYFKGYDGSNKIEYQIKEEITTFGKGSGLSVTYVSSSGQEYICTNDTIIKTSDYRVDRYTTSEFRYGIWYYNAKELKDFADQNHLPVLAEWSSVGCEPCRDFRINTWRNKEFQETIKNKPCLLCRIELGTNESWNSPTNTERYFISHNWGDPKTLIPQLIYYWPKSDGSVYKEIWNYNYRTDPANANYQTVLNKLNNMLGSYQGDEQYKAPTILNSLGNRINYYNNEDNDTIGKYFICDYKELINDYSKTQISIDLKDGIIMPVDEQSILEDDNPTSLVNETDMTVFDKIEINQIVTIPCLTYQYFTTSDKESFYDKEGVIFKVEEVDSIRKIIYIYQFSNNEYSEEIIDDTQKYKTGQIITLNNITNYSSFDDIIEYGTSDPLKLIVIFKLSSNDQSKTFKENILGNTQFQKWLKCSDYIFISVQSDNWDNNAPKALADFEKSISFEDSTDEIPKILVFKACSGCIVGEKYAIYCKKTIKVDLTKNYDYFTSLIDSYSLLS